MWCWWSERWGRSLTFEGLGTSGTSPMSRSRKSVFVGSAIFWKYVLQTDIVSMILHVRKYMQDCRYTSRENDLMVLCREYFVFNKRIWQILWPFQFMWAEKTIFTSFPSRKSSTFSDNPSSIRKDGVDESKALVPAV